MGFYVRDKKTGELRKLVTTGVEGHSHLLKDISDLTVTATELNRVKGLDKSLTEKIKDIITAQGIGATSYLDMTSKPKINGQELKGSMTSADLLLASEEHSHSYEELTSIPKINGTQIVGNKTGAELGLADKTHSHEYAELENLPKLNDISLIGNKTGEDLGLANKDHTHALSSIQGILTSLEEINYLQGLDENIMSKVRKITGGNILGYPTSFASYQNLLDFSFSSLNPANTYLMYVSEDESRGGNSTVYLATFETNNADNLPSYAGLGSLVQRDFSINRIDLTSEVKGKLPINNIEVGDFLTQESLTPYMKKTDYLSQVNEGNVKRADEALKIRGINKTNAELVESLNNVHEHENKNVLDLLSMGTKGDLLFNKKRIVADAPEYGVQAGRSEW